MDSPDGRALGPENHDWMASQIGEREKKWKLLKHFGWELRSDGMEHCYESNRSTKKPE